MDNRFANMFGLTEDQTIALLETPVEELVAPTEHYVAVSHLINFPTERSINALVKVLSRNSDDLYDRITRRKALESLGKLKAVQALPMISACLSDGDCYTVENAVWAIGEIGTKDEQLLEQITAVLSKSGQSYRTVIQTIAKLNYQPALTPITKFMVDDNKSIASAAITAACRLRGDYRQMAQVAAFLQDDNVNVRRACIQDLIDAGYEDAIPAMSRCPVSMVFRLRGIRLLAESGRNKGNLDFDAVQPHLERTLRDHPVDLALVHKYDQDPTLDFAINELYHTDFGRCYLASKTILELYPEEAPQALQATWDKEAHNDYGAHYHVVKLYGWLRYLPAYNLLVEALQNTAPQFQKSRTAAAIALGNLGEEQAIPLLQEALSSKIFALQYASLLALQQLGDNTAKTLLSDDVDWLIKAKAATL